MLDKLTYFSKKTITYRLHNNVQSCSDGKEQLQKLKLFGRMPRFIQLAQASRMLRTAKPVDSFFCGVAKW